MNSCTDCTELPWTIATDPENFFYTCQWENYTVRTGSHQIQEKPPCHNITSVCTKDKMGCVQECGAITVHCLTPPTLTIFGPFVSVVLTHMKTKDCCVCHVTSWKQSSKKLSTRMDLPQQKDSSLRLDKNLIALFATTPCLIGNKKDFLRMENFFCATSVWK